MTLGDFHEAVVRYCALTGGSVTSSVRTRIHNATVGGVPHSAHIFGLAADVVYDNKAVPVDGADVASRLGLKLIREGDHDHLQPATWIAG